jgi:hypothetical protein
MDEPFFFLVILAFELRTSNFTRYALYYLNHIPSPFFLIYASLIAGITDMILKSGLSVVMGVSTMFCLS